MAVMVTYSATQQVEIHHVLRLDLASKCVEEETWEEEIYSLSEQKFYK